MYCPEVTVIGVYIAIHHLLEMVILSRRREGDTKNEAASSEVHYM